MDEEFQQEWKEKFAILLHPFAPHMAEELFQMIQSSEGIQDADNLKTIYNAPWPEYDEFMLIDDEVIIAVQVNGKLR